MRQFLHRLLRLDEMPVKHPLQLRHRDLRQKARVKILERQAKLRAEPVHRPRRRPALVKHMIGRRQHRRQIIHQRPRPIKNDVPNHPSSLPARPESAKRKMRRPTRRFRSIFRLFTPFLLSRLAGGARGSEGGWKKMQKTVSFLLHSAGRQSINRHGNKTKSKRKPSAAFMKPVQPDDKLAKVVGAAPLPRTELTKKLWVYIRKNGLQDKKVRTQINADESLQAVFNGKKSVSMFEMTKLVSGHVK